MGGGGSHRSLVIRKRPEYAGAVMLGLGGRQNGAVGGLDDDGGHSWAHLIIANILLLVNVARDDNWGSAEFACVAEVSGEVLLLDFVHA